MNFDFGSVLTRALRITWRHKVLWILFLLPMLLPFLLLPFFAPLIILLEGGEGGNPVSSNEAILSMVMLLAIILLIVGSFILNSISMSATTLGVIRAERGEGSLTFADLLRDSLGYFGRILGVILISGLTIGLVFTLFFLMVIILTLVTIGLASICLQPIMLLISPFMLLVVAVMEAGYTMVITQDLGTVDALKRALQIVRLHIWKYVIITLIVYLGSSILTGILVFPLMMPIFAVPLLMDAGWNAGTQLITLTIIIIFGLFFLLLTLFSSVTGTFMKSSLVITCLHLSDPPAGSTADGERLPAGAR